MLNLNHLFDVFSIFVVLVLGAGSYFALQFTDLPVSVNVLIAACCRTVSLLLYRHYLQLLLDITAWLVFQWLIPLVVFAELFAAACIVGDGSNGEFN